MFNLGKIFGGKKVGSVTLTKEQIATLLQTNKEALEEFERVYKKDVLDVVPEAPGVFDVNAKQAASFMNRSEDENVDEMVHRIVNELLAQTSIYSYDGETVNISSMNMLPDKEMVTLDEVLAIDESNRPQLTGNLMKKDINGDSYSALLYQYNEFMTRKDPKVRQMNYNMFRQGLDILDLDPITYEIIGTNQNSMGHWLPALVGAVEKQKFFKVPKTTIIKVPMTLLQLTRQDYGSLTPTTLRIVDEFCMKAFNLDVQKDYFIKTGTYSSKFDFRNAHVQGEKEVRELGEYLLFIHFQALQMASPLCQPCIYGVSTTNEWVVREFIHDVENNPCIYKGLPLHTEYRVFVDFDENKLLGISPYWKPDVMKNRFSKGDDADSPHQKHDYIIYLAHEKTLMSRYEANKDRICDEICAMIPNIHLSGQWSIDVMQNGDNFYIIDMALAANSALNDCVKKEELKPLVENWIPNLQPLLPN